MVDLGANVGRFTSIFARYGCKVHSFEPTDKTFQVLCKRFENKSNVICHKKAASVKNDMVKFYHHELSNYNPVYWSDGNSLLSSKTNVNKDDYEIVECIDFSEFIFSITQSQNVDLVKMDVEGAELLVLSGAEHLFKDLRPVWFVEVDDDRAIAFGKSANAIFEFFLDGGYRAFVFDDEDQLFEVFSLSTTVDYLFIHHESELLKTMGA